MSVSHHRGQQWAGGMNDRIWKSFKGSFRKWFFNCFAPNEVKLMWSEHETSSSKFIDQLTPWLMILTCLISQTQYYVIVRACDVSDYRFSRPQFLSSLYQYHLMVVLVNQYLTNHRKTQYNYCCSLIDPKIKRVSYKEASVKIKEETSKKWAWSNPDWMRGERTKLRSVGS